MIEIGTTNAMTWTVEREQLASAFGSGLVDVLATPVLVGFCEECARTMVDGHLPAGQKTVGSSIRLDHLTATPFGMRVTVTARLVEIDRRRLRFEIEAHDEIELVGRATHERFIIDSDRFEDRLRQKTQKTQKTQDASSQSLGDRSMNRRYVGPSDGACRLLGDSETSPDAHFVFTKNTHFSGTL